MTSDEIRRQNEWAKVQEYQEAIKRFFPTYEGISQLQQLLREAKLLGFEVRCPTGSNRWRVCANGVVIDSKPTLFGAQQRVLMLAELERLKNE